MELLGIKPRVFGVLCQCSATELQLPPATTPLSELAQLAKGPGPLTVRCDAYASNCTLRGQNLLYHLLLWLLKCSISGARWGLLKQRALSGGISGCCQRRAPSNRVAFACALAILSTVLVGGTKHIKHMYHMHPLCN